MEYSIIWISDKRRVEHRVEDSPTDVVRVLKKEKLRGRKGVRIISPYAELLSPKDFRKGGKMCTKN